MSNTSLNIQFTRIVAQNRCGKVYKPTGEILNPLKKVNQGALSVGDCTVVTVGSLHEFAEHLKLDAIVPLIHDGAIYSYGIPKPELKLPEKFLIKARKAISSADAAQGNVISRTRDNFTWPSTAIVMLDFDVKGDQKVLEKDDLIRTVRDAFPFLKDVELLWAASSSSYIYKRGQSSPVIGLKGQRLYFVMTGIDTEADQLFLNEKFRKQLELRLWHKKLGHVEVSASGSLLDRFLVDTGVWQPERVDFICGAHCEGDYYQDRPHPEIIPGTKSAVNLIDVLTLPVDEKSAEKLRNKARAELKTSVKLISNRFVDSVKKDASGSDYTFAFTHGEFEDALNVNRPVLRGNHPIFVVMDDGVAVLPVKAILANKGLYEGRLTLDPVRPWYDDFDAPLEDSDDRVKGKTGNKLLIAKYGIGREVGKLLLTVAGQDHNDPILHSMASGAKSYVLSASCIENIDAIEAEVSVDTVTPIGDYNILDNIGAPAVSRPSIRASAVRSIDVPELSDWLKAHPDIFIRDNQIIKIINGDNGRVFTEDLTPVNVRGILNRGINYFVYARNEDDEIVEKQIPIDSDSSVNILTDSTHKCGYKPLKRVVANPILNLPSIYEKVSLPMKKGYDSASSTWWNVDIGKYQATLANMSPSLEDAKAAYQRVMAPFSEFNIPEDHYRGGLLAGLMTAAFRHSTELAPMFVINANRRDVGKSLLSHCLARLTTTNPEAEIGQLDLTRSLTDPAELSKLFVAALSETPEAIIFDNTALPVNFFHRDDGSGIKHDTLTAVLSYSTFRDRKLATNDLVNVSTEVLWILNGINIKFKNNDIVRRSIPINLNYKEVANTKLTGIDLLKHISNNRIEMINDLLIILLAYHNGPDGKVTQDRQLLESIPLLGTFEEWDGLIRRSIIWLSDHIEGLADPILGQDALMKDTDESLDCDDLFKILGDYCEVVGEFKASDLTEDVAPRLEAESAHHRVRERLFHQFKLGEKVNSSRSIGKFLSKFEGLADSKGNILRKRVLHGYPFWCIESNKPEIKTLH